MVFSRVLNFILIGSSDNSCPLSEPNQSVYGLLRPSSDVVLLLCRTKLPLASTVVRQENNFDSDVVTESNRGAGMA